MSVSSLKRLFPCLSFALFLCVRPAFLTAQDGLQFNAPYLCADGSTYVVHRCETGPKGEFCFYQRDNNSERFNRRADVANQMRTCNLKAAPAAAPTVQGSSDLQLNTPYECPGDLNLTIFECQRQAGQEYCQVRAASGGKLIAQVPKPRSEIVQQLKACKAGLPFNPPYMAEFPIPYRVVQGMLVGDPQQNVTRAIGAFYQLSEIIKVFASQHGGALMPDEKRYLDDYVRVQGKMVQAAEQKFPGQKFNPAGNPYHFKPSDPRFGFEGIPVWVTYLSPGLQDQFARIVGGNDPVYMAKVDQERRAAMKKADSDAASQLADMQEKSLPQDRGSVEMRRCMESGRSEVECLGAGLKTSVAELTGTTDLLDKGAPGLRLTGLYGGTNLGLRFEQDSVVVGCGSLVPQTDGYSVVRTGSQILVTIGVHPSPIVLSYRPDGRLTGPTQISVAGRVLAGRLTASTSTSYEPQTQTTTTSRTIDAADVSNYNADQVHQNGMEYSVDEQSTSTTYTPAQTTRFSIPTAPKTDHCNAARLQPKAANESVSGILTRVLGTSGNKSINEAPGLRMNGTYAASGGLKIEFRDNSATLECGNALSSEGYEVVPQSGQLVVRFQHKTGPLNLILQTNGTLSGSGTVEVNGRRMYKGANGETEFTPVSARCPVSTLSALRADQ